MTKNKFEPGQTETRRIVKNVVVIGSAFMLHFTAYTGTANLQSSVNADDGLGTASRVAVYTGLMFSNIFLPASVIKWLGAKWTMSLSFLMYMPWIASQMWPRFYTMIPAALLLGLAGGPLWCSKCTYVAVVSEAYSQITNIPASALFTRFLGLFFMLFQLKQVWNNLISSLVISSGKSAAAGTSVNASLIPEVCGANFLPSADSKLTLQHQPTEKIQMVSGIFLACMASAALIVAVGLDPMKRYEAVRARTRKKLSGCALLAVTLKLLAEPNQLMIILINIFVGYEQAFFSTNFTAAFVSCTIGTGSVGFVMMTYGIADAIGCLVSGYIAKLTGRMPLISLAAAVHTLLFVTLLTWPPQAQQLSTIYLIAVVWGLCDSVWTVQIYALSRCLFPGREEAAFSNCGLWGSVGFIILYVLCPYFRTDTKTYIMLVGLLVGLGLYYVVEFRHRMSKKMTDKRNMIEEQEMMINRLNIPCVPDNRNN